jgi:O-antigen/teichoic acid export membrane protein
VSGVSARRLSSVLRRILGNTSWLVVERIIRILTGFLVGVLVARYLGKERYGVLQYAISLTSFIGILVYLGLQGIVVRDLVARPHERDVLLGTTIILKAVGALVTYALLATIYVAFAARGSDETAVVLIVAAGLLLRPLETVNYWFESQVQSKYTALRQIFTVVLTSGSKIVLIAVHAPLSAFAGMVFAEVLVGGFWIVLFYTRRVGSLFAWRFSFAKARELLGQSWLLIFSGFLATVNLKVDQIMLKWMSGSGEVGIYAVAVTLSEAWYFISVAIVTSVFPSLVEARKSDPAKYKAMLQKVFDVLFLIALTVAIAVTFCSRLVIGILYGAEFLPAAVILMVHVWAGLFAFMRQLFSRWLIMEGLLTYSFYSHGSGALANVVLNALLIPKYGGFGAAIATLISYAVSSYFSLFLFRSTRPIAIMMSRAMLSPFRLAARAARAVLRLGAAPDRPG